MFLQPFVIAWLPDCCRSCCCDVLFSVLNCSVLIIFVVRLQFCTQCMWQEHEMATCTWNLHNFEVQKTWRDTVSRRPNLGHGGLGGKTTCGKLQVEPFYSLHPQVEWDGMLILCFFFISFPGVLCDSCLCLVVVICLGGMVVFLSIRTSLVVDVFPQLSWIRQDQLQHFDECAWRLQKVATCIAYDEASTRVPSTSQCVTWV